MWPKFNLDLEASPKFSKSFPSQCPKGMERRCHWTWWWLAVRVQASPHQEMMSFMTSLHISIHPKMRSQKRWFDFQAFQKRSLESVWIYFGSAAKFWREYRKDAKHLALEHKLNVPLGCWVLNHSLQTCGQKSLLSGFFKLCLCSSLLEEMIQ